MIWTISWQPPLRPALREMRISLFCYPSSAGRVLRTPGSPHKRRPAVAGLKKVCEAGFHGYGSCHHLKPDFQRPSQANGVSARQLRDLILMRAKRPDGLARRLRGNKESSKNPFYCNKISRNNTPSIFTSPMTSVTILVMPLRMFSVPAPPATSSRVCDRRYPCILSTIFSS